MRTSSHNRSPTVSRASGSAGTMNLLCEHAQSGERVDRGALQHSLELDVLVRTMRCLEQPRPVAVRGNALRRVETIFEQAGTHLETRRAAGDVTDAVSQCAPDGMVRR